MKKLILGTIPVNFNPAKYIPLGPFCFLDNEEIYPEWENLSFPSEPFQDDDAILEISRLTSSFANNLIPQLVDKLNQINQTNYSDKFWKLMILPWLLILIQIVWDRQERMLQFIDSNKNENIFVELMPSNYKWKFSSLLDYLESGVINPIYNEWLFSRILELNMPENWTFSYKKTFKNEIKEISKKNNLKRYFYKKLKYNRCNGVYGIKLFESLLWSLFLAIKPKRINSFINQNIKDKENVIDKINFKVDINEIIMSSIPECYKNLESLGLSKPKTNFGKLRLVGPQIYYDEESKYILAHYKEGGERIISTQHGWPYGSAKVFPFAHEIEYKQDVFFSWGWTKHEQHFSNVKPVSSPYLSKYMNKHKERNSNIIFVGNLGRLYPIRLETIYPQPTHSINYRKNKLNFFQHLEKNIQNNVLYRPSRKENGGLKDYSYLKEKIPRIKILKNNDLHAELLKCKLLIIDHPGTTFNIAMAANIPTICFYNKNIWALSQEAKSYYKILEKVGIIFDSEIDAAKKINGIFPNIKGWWLQSKIQNARDEFSNQYARTNKMWRIEWIKELWKI